MPAPAYTAAARALRSRTVAPWLAAALACLAAVLAILAVGVAGALFGLERTSIGGYRPSAVARSEIPARYLRLYQSAGVEYGLDPWILAAIGSIESDHGRSTAPGVRSGVNRYGCCAGPMQFNIRNGPPSTWDGFGVDGNRDGRRSPYDPADAIPAAASYLQANGAPGDYQRALLAYNHAQWYLDQVLAKAAEYRAAPAGGELAAERASVRELLRNPRLEFTPLQRADLLAGGLDPRVIDTLGAIGKRHTVVITALRADHAPGSNHEAGRAFDVGAVDGEICHGTRSGPCAELVRELASVQGPARSTELIYCWDPDGSADPRGFARTDHCGHIHVGWDA
jgi:hypothetical protein